MSVNDFPISDRLSPKQLLAAASNREFKGVLVLGYYGDGEIRHASTLTRERELWLLELRKAILLGLIDGASVPLNPTP